MAFPWRTIHLFSFHSSLSLSYCGFCFFKFSTRYSIFSIDCLNSSNSPDEVFFKIGNIKTQNVFLFSNATLHSHHHFLFMYNLSASLSWCNAPYIAIVFLISCSHLSIHSLSTVVFMLCILIQPLPMHLLLLFCFSHNVLILGTIDAFTHIPLLLLLSFLSLPLI